MQMNIKVFFFLFWRPNGGVRWLGQMPNFFRKTFLKAPLNGIIVNEEGKVSKIDKW